MDLTGAQEISNKCRRNMPTSPELHDYAVPIFGIRNVISSDVKALRAHTGSMLCMSILAYFSRFYVPSATCQNLPQNGE